MSLLHLVIGQGVTGPPRFKGREQTLPFDMRSHGYPTGTGGSVEAVFGNYMA